MSDETDNPYGFAPAHDRPLPYMERIRTYYLTLGYEKPYEWAHFAEVPFQPLAKPLSESRLALLTTAAPYQPDKGDQGPGAPYNAAAKFYEVYSGDSSAEHDLRISHVGYDRKHSTAEDMRSWFPLAQLRRLAAERRIGELAPRFHGLPTNRSHRATIEIDAEAALKRCREDAVEAAVLVAN
jgi:Glycine/sarcosine/betaine reductase selenoprotein B (GRDB)